MGDSPAEGIGMISASTPSNYPSRALPILFSWLRLIAVAICGTLIAKDSPPADEQPTVILILGAPGEDDYATNFTRWANQWSQAADQAHAKLIKIGFSSESSGVDRDLLENTLTKEPREGRQPLWLVLIGHGTFDGKKAKFNLRAADITDTDLALWLQPITRPTAVINCASASGPFLNALSAPHRVVVTATRSGHEQNYARFGEYLAEAITNPEADLDKDNQISLLEAFLRASHRVSEFYAAEGRLATEHPLLDDNGDGRGTPPDWFRGVRVVKKAADGAAPDGARAHQFHLIRSTQEQFFSSEGRAKRDELEIAIAKLREQKEKLTADDYYRKLEALLIELARLYQHSERASFE